MKPLLIIAFIGNLVDTASTLILHHGYGFTEANPIMAQLLQYPWLFVSIKILTMSAITLWLWRNRNSRYAKIASWVAALIYGAITIYYVIFFMLLAPIT